LQRGRLGKRGLLFPFLDHTLDSEEKEVIISNQSLEARSIRALKGKNEEGGEAGRVRGGKEREHTHEGHRVIGREAYIGLRAMRAQGQSSGGIVTEDGETPDGRDTIDGDMQPLDIRIGGEEERGGGEFKVVGKDVEDKRDSGLKGGEGLIRAPKDNKVVIGGSLSLKTPSSLVPSHSHSLFSRLPMSDSPSSEFFLHFTSLFLY
jgi:hypothetical protein